MFGLFRPLADPDDFGHAGNLAQIVLNFIIMLVYAVIAPLTVYIQAFCFMLVSRSFVALRPYTDNSSKQTTSPLSCATDDDLLPTSIRLHISEKSR